MAIFKPSEMDFSGKHIIMIESGTPGIGKSTLACSAPKPLIIDTDNGMCRVRASHRKDSSMCKTFDEVRADIAEARKAGYETIVIDTGGALIEMMKMFVIDHPNEFPGGSQKAVSVLSQKGYGYIKQLFLDFSAELRRDFNVIYIFHEQKTKDDDQTVYEIICEGSARTQVYQPADLAAHMFVQNGKRYLAFTPTEQYFAKGAYGINGIIEVPELKDGEPNDFITKLFQRVRDGLKAETDTLGPQKELYDQIMSEAKDMMSAVNTPEDVTACLDTISKMEHALTSEKELKAMLKARCKELNIVWDKEAKVWKNA